MSKVLDLSGILKRDEITLEDGSAAELRNPQEFNLVEEVRYQNLLGEFRKFKKVRSEADVTEEMAAEMQAIVDRLAHMLIVDLGDRQVSGAACALILQFWMDKHGLVPKDGEVLGNRQSRRTTAASSRGSKPSTAATRKSGSASRRTR